MSRPGPQDWVSSFLPTPKQPAQLWIVEEAITEFLAGDRSYSEAMRLYCLYGKNRVIKKACQPKNEKRMLPHLIYKLGMMVQRNIIIEDDPFYATEYSVVNNFEMPMEAPISKESDRALPGIAFHFEPVTEPETRSQDQLAIEKSRLHGQRAKLSNSLRSFAMHDDAGRAKVVRQIKDLTKQMNSIRIKQNGEAPAVSIETPAPSALSIDIDMRQSLLNTRSNLSKAKRKLNTIDLGSKAWQAAKDKVQRLQSELQELERIMKNG